jgi:hypothetical protein
VNFVHHKPKEHIDIFLDGYIVSFGEDDKSNKVSDTSGISLTLEKILEIYSSGNFHLLDKINGHYNVVVYDSKKNKVIVITDKYGMRPLYWFNNSNILIISTIPKIICQHEQFDKKINYPGIADFIKFEWVTNDATFFQNINRFSAATINVFSEGNLKTTKYYNWPSDIVRNNCSIEENAEKGFNLLKRAVNRTLTGVSFPGVTISGGLDSRILAGFIHLAGFEPSLYHCRTTQNETIGARGIAGALNVTLFESSPLRLYDGIENFAILNGDGCTSINQFWLMKLFKDIIMEKAIDCVYNGFFLDMLLNPPDYMCYHYMVKDKIVGNTDKRYLANTIYGLPEGYLIKYFADSRLANINEIALNNIEKYLSSIECEDPVYFSQILYLLTRGKRYTLMMPILNEAFCSIRFPGLDYDLVDFGLSLPVFQFQNPLVYFRIFEKYFPELNEIVWGKTGMPLIKGMQPEKKLGKPMNYIRFIVRRLTLGKIDFGTLKYDYNYLLRNNKEFRAMIMKILCNNYCIQEGIIGNKGLHTLISHIDYGRNIFGILERILTIELFFNYFVRS